MELMLGLPPMNQMDATATPMFDCFTNTPDYTPFDAVTNNVPAGPDESCAEKIADSQLRKDALVSARLPLAKPDQCPEGCPQPHPLARHHGRPALSRMEAVKLVDDDD